MKRRYEVEPITITNLVLLWIAVLFNLLLSLALIRQRQHATRVGGLKVGDRAPNFTAKTLQGEAVSLASYASRTVAFIFVSPNCGPCREALPRYEALHSKAKRSGAELVLVSIADLADTETFVNDFQISLPVLVAPSESNSFMSEYKATGTPFFCLVGPDGKIQSSGLTGPETGEWQTLIRNWTEKPSGALNLTTS